VSDARHALESLDEPWQLAVTEAWASWRAGSAGVGAVISDAAGGVVAAGRNRMLEQRTEPGVLASTMLAHGEMNALAMLPLGPTEGPVIDAHRDLRPRHLEVARSVAQDHQLARVADQDGDVVDALERLWPSLVELGS
jgi:hypothetical protein